MVVLLASVMAASACSGTNGPSADINDGNWSVGQEIKPGFWHSEGRKLKAGEKCQWSVHGSNGATIQNFGPLLGPSDSGPRDVWLEKGQEFDTDGCGHWEWRHGKPVK